MFTGKKILPLGVPKLVYTAWGFSNSNGGPIIIFAFTGKFVFAIHLFFSFSIGMIFLSDYLFYSPSPLN